MEAVREITDWKVTYRPPNHDYLLDGDRILAYRKLGLGEIISTPSRPKLDRRGRKFIKLDSSLFTVEKGNYAVIRVLGSKGQVYYVDPEAKTCTCAGFTYRGACKHLAEHG